MGILTGVITGLLLFLTATVARFLYRNKTLAHRLAPIGQGVLLGAVVLFVVVPVFEKSHTLTWPVRPQHFWFIGFLAGSFLGLLAAYFFNRFVHQISNPLVHRQPLIWLYMRMGNEEQHELIKKLSSIDVFHEFPHKRIHLLIGALDVVEYEKGEVIIEKDSPADSAYVVLKGKVEGSIGGEVLPAFDPSNALFNINVIVSQIQYNVGTAIALEKTRLIRIPKEKIEVLRSEFPSFDKHIKRVAEERMDKFRNWLDEKPHPLLEWSKGALEQLDQGEETIDVNPFESSVGYWSPNFKQNNQYALLFLVPPLLLLGSLVSVAGFREIINGEVVGALHLLFRPLTLGILTYLIFATYSFWITSRMAGLSVAKQWQTTGLISALSVGLCWITVAFEPLFSKSVIFVLVGVVIGACLYLTLGTTRLNSEDRDTNLWVPLGFVVYVTVAYLFF